MLVSAAFAGLIGAVLLAGLLLSALSRAALGPPPDSLSGAEQVGIPSASGSLLQGWWLAGRRGAGAVVLMQGVHGDRLGLVWRARLLADPGTAVLLFDFQAHGESTGMRITFGELEAPDAAAAVCIAQCQVSGWAQLPFPRRLRAIAGAVPGDARCRARKFVTV